MLRSLGRRLATATVTLLLVTFVVFGLIHLAPGSPLAETVDSGGGLSRVPPEVTEELARLYHLDQPLHRQYALWLGGVLRGDLGRSFRDRRPVADKIAERVGITVTLNALALVAMVLFAVPLGVLAAAHPGSVWDRAAGAATYLAYAVPLFWAALLLQMVFSMRLGWFPLAGLASDDAARSGTLGRLIDGAAHLVLPVACLAYGGVAYLSRFVRATLLDGSSAETIVAARARGLSALGVLVRHGFRRAAVPLLTLAGLLLPGLVGGSVIVEAIFAIPGLGRLFVDAAFQRDIPVLLGLTLLSGGATLAGIVLSDLAYAVADPRVRRG